MWNSVIGEHPILVPYDWFEYTTFSYKKTNFLPTTGWIKIFYVRNYKIYMHVFNYCEMYQVRQWYNLHDLHRNKLRHQWYPENNSLKCATIDSENIRKVHVSVHSPSCRFTGIPVLDL